MSSFPSIEEFDRCAAANKKIAQAIHWSDLPVNVIYCVKSKEEIEGEGMLLELVNRDNEETMVWAPLSVIISLCDPYPKNKIPYIRSLGTKPNVYQIVFLQDRQTSMKIKGWKKVEPKFESRKLSRIPETSVRQKKSPAQFDTLENIYKIVDEA